MNLTKEEQFASLAETISMSYKNKNADYADSFGTLVKKYGYISALTLLSDKFNRVESLILKDPMKGKAFPKTVESLRDTLLDLAFYSLMTVIELDKDAKDNLFEPTKEY